MSLKSVYDYVQVRPHVGEIVSLVDIEQGQILGELISLIYCVTATVNSTGYPGSYSNHTFSWANL